MNTIAANIPATKKLPRLHWPIMWTIVVTVVIVWGMHARLERYITPQRGIGYWLGIIGGSMMLLLLMYSARKRVSWMVLGVVGPPLILFHSNFSLGATNRNVALICMLLVASSGVVGRYIYTRLHAHMDGNEDTLEQLKSVGNRLRTQTTSIAFLPGLLDAIDEVERQYIVPPKGRVLRFLHLFSGPFRMARARWALRREIRHAVSKALMRDSPLIARHAERIAEVARRYADRRIEAGRRTSEYKLYARLFSFWHVLHIPLFFMLLIAGVVHVIAINVY